MMPDESEKTTIECSLGAMELAVETEDSDDAVEVFERIWEARIEEKQTADALEMRSLEPEVSSIDDL